MLRTFFLRNELKWLKCQHALVFELFPIANCPDPFVHISFWSDTDFFFIALIPRARFRCTTPGCQLFTSGWVQHKGRNQVTVNNTPNAHPCTKLLKVFRVITKRKKKRSFTAATVDGIWERRRQWWILPMRLRWIITDSLSKDVRINSTSASVIGYILESCYQWWTPVKSCCHSQESRISQPLCVYASFPIIKLVFLWRF
jgi:hypothetical protein